MKPVRVRPITLLCMVGIENNVAQIIIMIRRCVTNMKHVARLKVKVFLSAVGLLSVILIITFDPSLELPCQVDCNEET